MVSDTEYESPKVIDKLPNDSFYQKKKNRNIVKMEKKKISNLHLNDVEGFPTVIKMVNGTSISVGFTTGMIKIYNLVDKKCIQDYLEHNSPICTIEIISQERSQYPHQQFYDQSQTLILSGGGAIEPVIVIWNFEKAVLVSIVEGHFDMISSIQKIKYQNLVISSSFDSQLIFWNAKNGFNKVKSIESKDGPITCFCYNKSNKVLFTGHVTNKISLFKFSRGREKEID